MVHPTLPYLVSWQFKIMVFNSVYRLLIIIETITMRCYFGILLLFNLE